jgi:hypothetical protein
MEKHWVESFGRLELRDDKGHGNWSIRWLNCTPGLYWSAPGSNESIGPILGGIGLSASDRTDVGPLLDSNLSQIEVVNNRVELLYNIQGWHETNVRLNWWPSGDGQFDLMTEVATRSVGMLKAVEFGIVSTVTSTPESVATWLESFRDQEASMRSIDGRDAAWYKAQSAFLPDDSMTGVGNTKSWLPSLLSSTDKKISFLETTHPDDISRLYCDSQGKTIRTWTLGHDIERGVVFRTRHRCRIVQPDELINWNSLNAWQNEFISDPLPLFR